MAIHAHSTTAPALQRGLLRALAGCLGLPKSGDTLLVHVALSSEDTPAPTGVVPPHATPALATIEAAFADLVAQSWPEAPPERLPLPVPLPSLSAAFSRRRAIFGAVALAAAPVALTTAQAAPTLSANDRRLVELADAYEALDRRCNEHTAAHRRDHTPATDDEFDVLTSGFGPLEEECAATPADSLTGVIAKARLCRSPTARGCADNEHAFSIADDLYRLHAARRIAHV